MEGHWKGLVEVVQYSSRSDPRAVDVRGVARASNIRRRSYSRWAPPRKNFLLKILVPAVESILIICSCRIRPPRTPITRSGSASCSNSTKDPAMGLLFLDKEMNEAKLYVSTMRAPSPTARPANAFYELGAHPFNVLNSRFRFFDGNSPAYPFVAREGRNIFPCCPRRRISCKRLP